jgi:hypothetical protein
MAMKIRILFGLTAIVLALISIPAMAQEKAVQLSLLSPIQLFPENSSVAGFRISLLYGKNASVNGIDWGLVTHTTVGQSTGIQSSFVSIADADFSGGQYGFVNLSKGKFEGVQWGFVNSAADAHGFQFGVVNYAQRLKGLQLGLINIIKQNGRFPIFPILNWSF